MKTATAIVALIVLLIIVTRVQTFQLLSLHGII